MAATDEDLVDAARAAARSARRAAAMTLIAVMVALAILALDNSIKRSILVEVGRARKILDEFKLAALGALNDGPAGTAPAGSGTAGDGGNAVVHAARPPQAADHHENGPLGAAGRGPRGPQPGTGGDE